MIGGNVRDVVQPSNRVALGKACLGFIDMEAMAGLATWRLPTYRDKLLQKPILTLDIFDNA